MAPSFGRSISLSLTPARSSKPRHVRSVSLPCRSHPLLVHLNAQIAAVRSWIHDRPMPASGLAHIHALHVALADLLILQDTQNALRRASKAGERLLDAFLLLADAHRGFQEALLELRHVAAESRAALWRRDAARLSSASRSQLRAEKDLGRLAVSISSKCVRLNLVVNTDSEEAEMAGTLMEAAYASAAASVAVFSAVASMSSPSTSSSCRKIASAFGSLGKKAGAVTVEAAIERLHAVDRCFQECDGVCDTVFRSIVQIRVSLLNIMTPTI